MNLDSSLSKGSVLSTNSASNHTAPSTDLRSTLLSCQASGTDIDLPPASGATTLWIDDPLAELSEAVDDEQTVRPSLTYIHGVVQKQQVYIVTNLLEGKSRSLFQPQMVWTIGRNREAAIPLQDGAMSRRHAVIFYNQLVGFQLIDLNSMNGSFVNGLQIQHRCSLRDGDRIRLGNTDFVFFTSRSSQHIGAVHSEVLARFNASKSCSHQYTDNPTLEEPENLIGRKGDNW